VTSQHITIQEASERTGYTLPEIRRKLQSGNWIAVAMAELRHHNGVPAGFDMVTVPQDVVRQIFMNRMTEYSFDAIGNLTATITGDQCLLEVAVGDSENPLIDAKPGYTAPTTTSTIAAKTVNPSTIDNKAALEQLERNVAAAFGDMKPVRRKSAPVVFVTDRRQSAPKVKQPLVTESSPPTNAANGSTAKLAVVAQVLPSQTSEQTLIERNEKWLTHFELEEKSRKRGAMQRTADHFKEDRSKVGKGIKKAKELMAEKYKSGNASVKKNTASVFPTIAVKDGKKQHT